MRRFVVLILLGVCLLSTETSFARNREKLRSEVLSRNQGFYKDVFMNGGIYLTSRRDLPITRYLGLSIDYFVSDVDNEVTDIDSIQRVQTNIFCGYEEDTNGWLLYPDGEPRFRMVYFNGGSAGLHGESLTEKGRANVQQYIANGGSYLGTCAGMFIASKGAINSKNQVEKTDRYLNIWPGITKSSNLRKSRTSMKVEKRSPLLRYYDFGGDMRVDSVYHNGGGYIYYGENSIVPKGTEPLMRYIFKNNDSVKINNEVSTWAYKHNAESGRVVVTGSHPEGITQGERLDYMAAMALYALDGNAPARIKGELSIGELREMNLRTEDGKPEYTRIGDRQYHHFVVNIPKGCKNAVVLLEGYESEHNFTLSLCANHGSMAYHSNAPHQVVSKGCNKKLIIANPNPGKWYVSVFCETTVEAVVGKHGTTYQGCTEVLNGVPYSIEVDVEK